METHPVQCVKSLLIWSYSGPHFPAFGLNTERWGVFLGIQSVCGKILTRITQNMGIFLYTGNCRSLIKKVLNII